MSCRTMATRFWSSALAFLWCVGFGCGRDGPQARRRVLLYCASSAKPYAAILKSALESELGHEVVLAPLSPRDLLSATAGTNAGDFAVFAGPALRDTLSEREQVRQEQVLWTLKARAVAVRPFVLADLTQPGKRLGSGKTTGALGGCVSAALPKELRAAVAANVVYRSERPAQLLRMLRLGGLDAAFVWDLPPPPAALHVLPLSGDASRCPVFAVTLTSSRLSATEIAAVQEVWTRAAGGAFAPAARARGAGGAP